jgi:DNA-binding transcriptional regulator YhcF (GntR family)
MAQYSMGRQVRKENPIGLPKNWYDNAMPRGRSKKVAVVKEKLITRLRSGYYRAGERFFSNRGLAQYFEISYQTAHRIMQELEAEGWIERREYSGSYVSGVVERPASVALYFNSRAAYPQTFGERIMKLVIAELGRAGIAWQVLWDGAGAGNTAAALPIIWECPETLERVIASRGFAVLINERPPPGLAKSHIDSVSVDDHSGGVSAADLIRPRVNADDEVAVLQGPRNDRRNGERVEGFLSVLPEASVLSAESWGFDAGYALAASLARARPRAVFCTNDRLASAVVSYYRDQELPLPGIIGFDNAPVSEQMDLTTIAIPWEQMAQRIVEVAQRRLAGDTQTSIQYVLSTVPIVRSAFFSQ